MTMTLTKICEDKSWIGRQLISSLEPTSSKKRSVSIFNCSSQYIHYIKNIALFIVTWWSLPFSWLGSMQTFLRQSFWLFIASSKSKNVCSISKTEADEFDSFSFGSFPLLLEWRYRRICAATISTSFVVRNGDHSTSLHLENNNLFAFQMIANSKLKYLFDMLIVRFCKFCRDSYRNSASQLIFPYQFSI